MFTTVVFGALMSRWIYADWPLVARTNMAIVSAASLTVYSRINRSYEHFFGFHLQEDESPRSVLEEMGLA